MFTVNVIAIFFIFLFNNFFVFLREQHVGTVQNVYVRCNKGKITKQNVMISNVPNSIKHYKLHTV